MKRFAVAVGVSVLVGCSPIGNGRAAPGIVIECRGQVATPAAECQAWGEKLIAGMPDVAGRVARVVLTHNGGNARCAGDLYDAGGALLTTAAVICPQR